MVNNPLRRTQRTYRVFFESNGDGPWECRYCHELVLRHGQGTWDGNIHHLDEDVTNDVSENLVMVHVICHQHQHPVTPEVARRISETLRGRPSPTRGVRFSSEVNAKKGRPGPSNPFYGKKHDVTALTKMRRPRRRVRCTDCGNNVAINWINRHKNEGRCVATC